MRIAVALTVLVAVMAVAAFTVVDSGPRPNKIGDTAAGNQTRKEDSSTRNNAAIKRTVSGVVNVVSSDMETWVGTRTDGQGYAIIIMKTEQGLDVECLFRPGYSLPALERGDRVTFRGVVQAETTYTLHLADTELVSHRPRRVP